MTSPVEGEGADDLRRRRLLDAGIIVAIIGATSGIGSVTIQSVVEALSAPSQEFDCTDERKEAIEIWEKNQITIPYSGELEEACQLNEVVEQLSSRGDGAASVQPSGG